MKTINVSYVENKEVPKKKLPIKNNKNLPKEEKIKKVAEEKSKKNIEKKIKKKKALEKKNNEREKQKKFDDMLKDLAEKKISKNLEKNIESLSNKSLDIQKPPIKEKELTAIINLLMNQINSNWTRPPGIKNIENLSIKIIITLDRTGNVTSISIPESTNNKINNDRLLRPYLDSAIRAIKKSSPFEGLEKHRYTIWKKININFMPFEANL
ncbi:MAG: TonB C-terminal domain-containing protein [Pseudomonadota bacterium]|nr:TonB C-terminal domain-containing protein [Pseudomonadota bacterium]